MTNAKLALLAGLLVPGVALAQINAGDTMGVTDAEILSTLEAEGYRVIEIEMEDGEIEVEAVRDGQMFEIEIAADTGLILEIELDDEDASEDS